MNKKRTILFEPSAYEEFVDWASLDKKLFKKIAKLIQEITKSPFEGTGKPEPLKHQLAGAWSRRINKEHRLVYLVDDKAITIISCKSHYH